MRESLVLARMMTRFWLRTYPHLRADLRRWQRLAAAIPNPQLRESALATLQHERLNAAGAALFSVLATAPDPSLLRLLVAFQIMWDYVDTLAEQPAEDPAANGTQLHAALADALAPGTPIADHYRLHPQHDDGGYLTALVETCRASCAALPAYSHVRETAVAEARRAAVQGINHAPAPAREPALRRWASAQAGGEDVSWFELAAAASSSLAIHALLVAAADPRTTAATVDAIHQTYFPWVCALSTLLDSLVDETEDAVSGNVSFIAHYASRAQAQERLREVAQRSTQLARRLPSGGQHAVIVAGMVAMYLSNDAAWTRAARPTTIAVLHASSAVALPLLCLMRVMRAIQF